MKIITGGVTAAKGFQAASTAAGIKYQGRTDMAMVYSEKPCVAAGTFTTNIVKAAPVKWDQEIVYQHPSAQVIICSHDCFCRFVSGFQSSLKLRCHCFDTIRQFLDWKLHTDNTCRCYQYTVFIHI